MDDTIHLNVYQALNGKTNTISQESKAFAENTLAKIISLVEVEEAIAAQFTVYPNLKWNGGEVNFDQPQFDVLQIKRNTNKRVLKLLYSNYLDEASMPPGPLSFLYGVQRDSTTLVDLPPQF